MGLMIVRRAICTKFIQLKKDYLINKLDYLNGMNDASGGRHKTVKRGISGLCINSASNTIQTFAKSLNLGFPTDTELGLV